ncbi:hypothetical protein [Metaplanococcus flavidus]|uniref:Lipoprotein n=1 Tax=Metaplanococcus flavidus TaxID=569883 RepID=A0ABW3LFN0_9BACL
MKRICLLVLLLILSACQSQEPVNLQDSENTEEVDLGYIEEGEKEYIFEDIESLIDMSQFVVIGVVEKAEDYAVDGTVYNIKLEHVYKGNISDSYINVYEKPQDMTVDQRVILFLEGWESELYSEPLYNALSESILVVENQKVLGKQKFLKNDLDDVKTLLPYIEKKSKESTNSKKIRKVKDRATTENELIELSTYVSVIVPKEISIESSNVKLVNYELVENIKGTLAGSQLFLPPHIKIGQKYKVYLQELDDGNITLTTRYGSVVPVE